MSVILPFGRRRRLLLVLVLSFFSFCFTRTSAVFVDGFIEQEQEEESKITTGAAAASTSTTTTTTTTTSAEVQPPLVTPYNLQRMKTAVWVNQDEVARNVGYRFDGSSPYPSNGSAYDVTIDPDANCYVVFLNPKRTYYDMITATSPPRNAGGYGVFLSHEKPCGVCSNLADLAIYLEQPDLTNPVRLCGFTSFVQSNLNLECLVEVIGFSDMCGTIWLHNTQYTRDNCLWLCLVNIFNSNNDKFGFIHPCEPNLSEDEDDNNHDGIITTSCTNTINQQPACDDYQYENGNQYRLNSCLQCDECQSGPLFQKIAGRTRRNSDIQSGIRRPPPLPSPSDDNNILNHNYFTS